MSNNNSKSYRTYNGSPISNGKVQFNVWNEFNKEQKENNMESNDELCDWKELKGNISKYIVRGSVLLAQRPTVSESQILSTNECYFEQRRTQCCNSGFYKINNMDVLKFISNIEQQIEHLLTNNIAVILVNNLSNKTINGVVNRQEDFLWFKLYCIQYLLILDQIQAIHEGICLKYYGLINRKNNNKLKDAIVNYLRTNKNESNENIFYCLYIIDELNGILINFLCEPNKNLRQLVLGNISSNGKQPMTKVAECNSETLEGILGTVTCNLETLNNIQDTSNGHLCLNVNEMLYNFNDKEHKNNGNYEILCIVGFEDDKTIVTLLYLDNMVELICRRIGFIIIIIKTSNTILQNVYDKFTKELNNEESISKVLNESKHSMIFNKNNKNDKSTISSDSILREGVSSLINLRNSGLHEILADEMVYSTQYEHVIMERDSEFELTIHHSLSFKIMLFLIEIVQFKQEIKNRLINLRLTQELEYIIGLVLFYIVGYCPYIGIAFVLFILRTSCADDDNVMYICKMNFLQFVLFIVFTILIISIHFRQYMCNKMEEKGVKCKCICFYDDNQEEIQNKLCEQEIIFKKTKYKLSG
eukprot:82426_1